MDMSGSSSGSPPRRPCFDLYSSTLSFHPPSLFSSHLGLPAQTQKGQVIYPLFIAVDYGTRNTTLTRL